MGLLLAPPELVISLIWLPSGIAVAAIFRLGWAGLLGIALATPLLQQFSFGIALPWGGVVALGQTLGPLVAAQSLRWAGFDPGFSRRRDIGIFAGAALLGMMISPAIGASSLGIAGRLAWSGLGGAWFSWWLGDCVGALTAAPLLLSLDRRRFLRLLSRRVEFFVWLVLTGATNASVFFAFSENTATLLPLMFLPIPFLVWSAMRFGAIGASLGTLFLAVAAASGTALGRGPFALPEALNGIFLLWAYLGTSSLLALMITGIEIGRALVEKSLRRSETRLLLANARLASATRLAEQRAGEAREAGKAKAQFLARLGHDIRTPMGGVIGMADLLLETDLDGQQRECARIIRNSGDAILRLLRDIMEQSKIEIQKLEVHPEPFDPAQVLREIVRLLAPSAKSKGLDLSVELRPDLPESWISDPGRIRQILMNLIENAVKFTTAGDVIVRAFVSSADGERLVFEVEDSGPGIPEKDLARIFRQPADAPTVPRASGLGLVICRHLAVRMGGELKVRTLPGKGSTFSLVLPQGVLP